MGKFTILSFVLLVYVVLVFWIGEDQVSIITIGTISNSTTAITSKNEVNLQSHGPSLPTLSVPVISTTQEPPPVEVVTHPNNLCENPDEKENKVISCKCADPSVPVSREKEKQWMKFHQQWIESVEYITTNVTSSSSSSSNKNDNTGSWLDVAMVGDSLIEHWNGTLFLNKKKAPGLRRVYEQYFTKGGGGKIEGVAFGASKDTSRNLLWHLQNGILTNQQFQPKVWLILVGTNDLGHGLCSKQSTLDGILNVADYIKSQRPNASILIHGLLPRGGNNGNEAQFTLGRYWKLIQWINHELQVAAQQRSSNGFYYMDADVMFLNTIQTEMNSKYTGDGLHPNEEGLKIWGRKMSQAIQAIIVQKEDQISLSNSKK